jgi:hypothetical protein
MISIDLMLLRYWHTFFGRLNPLNILAWLKACSPKVSFSIQWVSAAVLLSLKQNLMQVLCSLTPAISIFADTREHGVKKTAKTQKHVPVARLLAERYKKRRLVAQVHSTNSLCDIIKFSEILGRPTYIQIRTLLLHTTQVHSKPQHVTHTYRH